MSKTSTTIGVISILSIAYGAIWANSLQGKEIPVQNGTFAASDQQIAQIRIVSTVQAAPVEVESVSGMSNMSAPAISAIPVEPAKEALLPVVDQPDILPEDQTLVNGVLMWLPSQCRDTLRNMVVRYSAHAERGQSTSTSILLRGGMDREEVVAVLIHECAHVTDLGSMKGENESGESLYPDGDVPTYRNDPSARFYSISWKNTQTHADGSRPEDFVSGYAMSDPFEDFAETYTMYALHNEAFVKLTEGNEALKAKYIFMRDEVFGSGFHTAPQITELSFGNQRVWDITKLAHSLTL